MRPTRFITAAMLLLCLTANAWATAYTSKADGNWSSVGQTTWNEVGKPGIGDTVTISHNITMDETTAVGDSPAAATAGQAILINTANKRLTLAAGVTMNCLGHFRRSANGAGLTMGAGSTFRFNSSGAGTPASQVYVMEGTAHGLTGTLITARGTSGSRCTITSEVATGAKGRISVSSWNADGQLDLEYTDLSQLGSASTDAIYNTNNGLLFRLVNCTVTSCGRVRVSGILDAATFQISNTVFSSSLDTSNGESARFGAVAGFTSGTRSVTFNAFDKLVAFYDGSGMTITDNYFALGIGTLQGNVWASFTRNLHRTTSATNTSLSGNSLNNYWLKDGAIDNPHFITPSQNTSSSVIGDIFEGPNVTRATDDGDCISIPAPSSAKTYTFTNNLILPIANGAKAGWCAGNALSGQGNANATVAAFDHNTYSAGGAAVGETYAGHAGLVTSLQSNLVFRGSNTTGYVLFDSGTNDNVPDLLTTGDYNWGHDLTSGYLNLEKTTGSYGTHDQSGDPQFVDPTRNFQKWAVAYGGASDGDLAATKIATGLAAIKADRTLIAGLITYVKEGFRPTNASLKNAGHDGVTIGALEGVFDAGGAARNRNRTGGLRRLSRDLLGRGAWSERDNREFFTRIAKAADEFVLAP